MPAERWELAGRGPTGVDGGSRGGALRRLSRRRRSVRSRLLRHLAARGGGDGPAAAARAGAWLGGPRGRRDRCPMDARDEAAGVFVGAIAGDYAELVAAAGSGGSIGRHTITGLQPQHHRQPGLLRARAARAEPDRGRRAGLLAGGRASRLREPAPGRERRWRSRAACTSTSIRSARSAPRGSAGSRPTAAASPSTRGPTASCGARAAASSSSSRSTEARADGDHVYCVIRGSAVNNDGGGDGLTVPSRSRAGGRAEARLQSAPG